MYCSRIVKVSMWVRQGIFHPVAPYRDTIYLLRFSSYSCYHQLIFLRRLPVERTDISPRTYPWFCSILHAMTDLAHALVACWLGWCCEISSYCHLHEGRIKQAPFLRDLYCAAFTLPNVDWGKVSISPKCILLFSNAAGINNNFLVMRCNRRRITPLFWTWIVKLSNIIPISTKKTSVLHLQLYWLS